MLNKRHVINLEGECRCGEDHGQERFEFCLCKDERCAEYHPSYGIVNPEVLVVTSGTGAIEIPVHYDDELLDNDDMEGAY